MWYANTCSLLKTVSDKIFKFIYVSSNIFGTTFHYLRLSNTSATIYCMGSELFRNSHVKIYVIMYVDFQAYHIIGWQHSQTIRSHVRKPLLFTHFLSHGHYLVIPTPNNVWQSSVFYIFSYWQNCVIFIGVSQLIGLLGPVSIWNCILEYSGFHYTDYSYNLDPYTGEMASSYWCGPWHRPLTRYHFSGGLWTMAPT